MSHIYLAGLFHETHTFLDETTGVDDFQIRRGDELLACAGDSSPLGGALESFQAWGWHITPGPDFRATPGGVVDNRVIECFWQDVESTWDSAVDAIFLVLHGAMVSTSKLDVEGEMLRRFRALPGAAAKPIFAVYDLHANFSDAMAAHADGVVAYRCNPHTDARDASVQAANLLRRRIDTGIAPSLVHRPAHLIWAPTATGTSDDPMRRLQQMARQFERENESIWAVNVSAGFAFADTPDTGVSFQIVTTSSDDARKPLDQLTQAAHQMNGLARPAEWSIDDVMTELVNNPVDGLTVLVEPADNIGGGAPGDTTGLLRALVHHRASQSAICINDPLAVEVLHGHRPTDRLSLPIGGRGSRFDTGPLTLDVELVSTSDGRFELADKQSHLASMSGDHFDMGRSAVVRHAGLQILLTSRKTPPFDLGQWRSQGIEPASQSVIVVKAAVAHRRAYDPITARSFTVDTPGPCRSDLSQLDYIHATRRSRFS